MVTYGKTVPKNAITAASSIKDPFNLTGVWVYLTNAEIKKSGHLKALELYASQSGTININTAAKASCSSSSQYPRNEDYACGTDPASAKYTCSQQMTKSKQTCSDIDPSLRFNSDLSVSGYQFTASFGPFNLAQGYNLIDLGSPLLNTGSLLAIQPSLPNQLALDLDSSLTDYYSDGVSPNLAPIGKRVLARAIVEPLNKVIGAFKRYSINGSHTLTVNITNNEMSGPGVTSTASIDIQQGIEGLTFAPELGTCLLTVPCNLISSVTAGTNITYEWFIESANITTRNQSVAYTFMQMPSQGVVLIARNQISSRYVRLGVLTGAGNMTTNMSGFYIDVVPKFAKPSDVVTVTAYFVTGFGVYLRFFGDGVDIGQKYRLCK
jgi:hypothetical protein